MDRRGFLGVIASAPIVGPAISRAIAEQGPIAVKAVRVSGSGAAGGTTGDPNRPNPPPGPSMRDPESWARVLRDARARAEIESVLYEQYRDVGSVDPDIDGNRSYSRMAKITFQRQRSVAEALRQRQTIHNGSRLRVLFGQALGWKP